MTPTSHAAHRKMCRRIAAVLVRAMAETDIGFPEMAAKLGRSEESLRNYMKRLIDGTEQSLSAMSDLATAMDCEIEFSMHRRPQPTADPEAPHRPGPDTTTGE